MYIRTHATIRYIVAAIVTAIADGKFLHRCNLDMCDARRVQKMYIDAPLPRNCCSNPIINIRFHLHFNNNCARFIWWFFKKNIEGYSMCLKYHHVQGFSSPDAKKIKMHQRKIIHPDISYTGTEECCRDRDSRLTKY